MTWCKNWRKFRRRPKKEKKDLRHSLIWFETDAKWFGLLQNFSTSLFRNHSRATKSSYAARKTGFGQPWFRRSRNLKAVTLKGLLVILKTSFIINDFSHLNFFQPLTITTTSLFVAENIADLIDGYCALVNRSGQSLISRAVSISYTVSVVIFYFCFPNLFNINTFTVRKTLWGKRPDSIEKSLTKADIIILSSLINVSTFIVSLSQGNLISIFFN